TGSASSGPTARARPPWCAPSSASSPPTPGRSCSAATPGRPTSSTRAATGAAKPPLGPTTLALEPPDAGQVVLGVNTRPAYLEQGRSELRDELTVLDQVGDGYDLGHLPTGT